MSGSASTASRNPDRCTAAKGSRRTCRFSRTVSIRSTAPSTWLNCGRAAFPAGQSSSRAGRRRDLSIYVGSKADGRQPPRTVHVQGTPRVLLVGPLEMINAAPSVEASGADTLSSGRTTTARREAGQTAAGEAGGSVAAYAAPAASCSSGISCSPWLSPSGSRRT